MKMIIIIVAKLSVGTGKSLMRNLENAAGNKPCRHDDPVLSKLSELYREAFAHDGFAEIKVEIRILRRGQKEVILHCGKQYRFVVDCVPSVPSSGN